MIVMMLDVIWMLIAFGALLMSVFLPEEREGAQTFLLWLIMMDVFMIRRKMT